MCRDRVGPPRRHRRRPRLPDTCGGDTPLSSANASHTRNSCIGTWGHGAKPWDGHRHRAIGHRDEIKKNKQEINV